MPTLSQDEKDQLAAARRTVSRLTNKALGLKKKKRTPAATPPATATPTPPAMPKANAAPVKPKRKS